MHTNVRRVSRAFSNFPHSFLHQGYLQSIPCSIAYRDACHGEVIASQSDQNSQSINRMLAARIFVTIGKANGAGTSNLFLRSALAG
jgi:hypothetical protein